MVGCKMEFIAAITIIIRYAAVNGFHATFKKYKKV